VCLAFLLKTAVGVITLLSVYQEMVGGPSLELAKIGSFTTVIHWVETAAVQGKYR
jgi:hypothetical protein